MYDVSMDSGTGAVRGCEGDGLTGQTTAPGKLQSGPSLTFTE